MVLTSSSLFIRDRFTWLAYFMLAYYAYLQASLGPLMPFLREELSLNYTVAGFHLSAFALGMVLAGLLGDAAARRLGRYVVFWGGGAGMATGALLLTLGKHPLMTIPSAFVMGFIGSFLLVMIQASLADHHGERRTIPLTEANIAASVLAAFAPLCVGLGETVGIGWRGGLFLGISFWVVMFWLMRDAPVPAVNKPSRAEAASRREKLPKAFWAYWVVILISVSIEWCMIFWGADFLENVVNLPKDMASTLISVFLGAMIVGRVIGSRLSHVIPGSRLLVAAVGAVAIGFPIFWLAQHAVLNVFGLFIAGLGVANLFPLTLSAAVTVASSQPDTASARISLAAGSAILLVPQILGAIADQVGIYNAYSLVVVLIFVMMAAVFFANHLSAAKM